MDNDLFEKGLAQRKATLGAEYVEKNLAAADDFTKPQRGPRWIAGNRTEDRRLSQDDRPASLTDR